MRVTCYGLIFALSLTTKLKTMKQLLAIATLLISLNSNAHDGGKHKKHNNVPPVGMRCTEDVNGKQCRGWSVEDEELCWKHSPYKRELKELRDARAKLRMKK